jgi:NTE family protein
MLAQIEVMKVGVVLSGGGIRGIAHIGLLKALEEADIEVDCFAGASVGALVSALASKGYKADEIMEIAKKNQIYKLVLPKWPQLGLGSLGKLPPLLRDLIGEDGFESLPKPVAVSVTNMTAGKLEIKKSGPLFDLIHASCSIPVLFKPVEINGDYYADGGVLNNMPAQAFRSECDILIGMDLVSGNPVNKQAINSIFKFTVRTFELAISSNAQEGKDLCDILLVPERAADQPVLYTKNLDKLYESGYQTAMDRIEEIRKLVNG